MLKERPVDRGHFCYIIWKLFFGRGPKLKSAIFCERLISSESTIPEELSIMNSSYDPVLYEIYYYFILLSKRSLLILSLLDKV
jgi:hypothetical protein